jgi:hypothetical protein
MDGDRFDSLARLVAVSTSRRSLLGALTAGLAGALVGAVRPAAAFPPASPSWPTTNRCGRGRPCDYDACAEQANFAHDLCVKDICADLTDEPLGKAPCLLSCAIARGAALKGCQQRGGCCGGLHCVDGICCEEANAANCGGRCVDATCPGDLVFNRAACRCECPPGTYACPSGAGATCFAVACPAGKTPDPATCQCKCPDCPGGKTADPTTCECRCPSLTCPQGQTQDPTTCECRCPDACSPGQTQDPTTCACTCGDVSCAGACCGGACIDLQTDDANCGRCGNACTGARTCRNGQCGCPPERPDLCNGVCTNFNYDRFACGGCGSVFICPGGFFTACCPGKGIGTGLCTNPDIDALNCGACGRVCPPGQKCQNGRCACPPGTRDCHGQCKITCEPEEQPTCPAGGGCNHFPPCSPSVAGCGCGTTTEGTGVCVPNPDCNDLSPCLASANCPPGAACVTDNCCDDGLPRCAPLCSAQTASAAAASRVPDRSLAGRLLAERDGITLIEAGRTGERA